MSDINLNESWCEYFINGELNIWNSRIARISHLSQDPFLCVAYGTQGRRKRQAKIRCICAYSVALCSHLAFIKFCSAG